MPSGVHPLGKQRRVSTKLVDRKGFDPVAIFVRKDSMSADELRDHAATVDVANQHNGNIRGLRKAHIGNITRPQVHLGGRSGTFDNHQIVLA